MMLLKLLLSRRLQIRIAVAFLLLLIWASLFNKSQRESDLKSSQKQKQNVKSHREEEKQNLKSAAEEWENENVKSVEETNRKIKSGEDDRADVRGTGWWQTVVEKGGVSAMHMTTTHADTVIMFDRTDFGPSQLRLDRGRCRKNPRDLALKRDCWAHSIEYHVGSNSIRPLFVFTDSWCSSGAFLADGTLLQTGGFNDGEKSVRRFRPCQPCDLCDWQESVTHPNISALSPLRDRRWYASDQILPDGTVIVVGGRLTFTYEFVPKSALSSYGSYRLPFLRKTYVPHTENNLYPFLHLSTDGSLFVFANKDSILLDYRRNRVLRTFPRMPTGGARNYPASGSSVMLALDHLDNFRRAEILICGGAADGAYNMSRHGIFLSALDTCGRIVITDKNPNWIIQNMPEARVMSDMLILPNSEILIINGARKGSAGWELAKDPCLLPLLYRPTRKDFERNSARSFSSKFSFLAPSAIPRLYHSTANVLRDGRVIVGGSNPHVGYSFHGVEFPTELRLETFSPYYLDKIYRPLRARIVAVRPKECCYGCNITVEFELNSTAEKRGYLEFTLYAPPFTTHSFSMNQRMLKLQMVSGEVVRGNINRARLLSPPSPVVAPPGYYMFFVVMSRIPSVGEWLRLG